MLTNEPRRLLCCFAHPDDETLGAGSTLAKYAAEGVQTYLLSATRGERGWHGVPAQDPGLQGMGRIREQELRDAACVLGLHEVGFLDYIDGELDRAPTAEAVARIAAHIRRIRPQVVITFGPDGAYGHPDHIAISQLTSAALVAAADPTFDADGAHAAHRVSKLYYFAETPDSIRLYDEMVGGLFMDVDGELRRFAGWPEWAVTTTIDGDAYWHDVLQAVRCHKSQLSTLGALEDMVKELHAKLLGVRHYYRVYSLVNGGRKHETDLFEGIN